MGRPVSISTFSYGTVFARFPQLVPGKLPAESLLSLLEQITGETSPFCLLQQPLITVTINLVTVHRICKNPSAHKC